MCLFLSPAPPNLPFKSFPHRKYLFLIYRKGNLCTGGPGQRVTFQSPVREPEIPHIIAKKTKNIKTETLLEQIQ